MVAVGTIKKIKESEKIEDLRKIARRLYKELENAECEIRSLERYKREGHELALKYKNDVEYYKGHIDRVVTQSIESGERLIITTRNDTLEHAARIAETFFEDDVVHGIQIAKAIRERIQTVNDTPKDDSFVIKTMQDVVDRVNARKAYR